MSTAAHNAIVTLVTFYGATIAEQQQQINELQAKLGAANEALKAAGEQLRRQSSGLTEQTRYELLCFIEDLLMLAPDDYSANERATAAVKQLRDTLPTRLRGNVRSNADVPYWTELMQRQGLEPKHAQEVAQSIAGEIDELQAKLVAANEALKAAGEQLRGQSNEPLSALKALDEWATLMEEQRYKFDGVAGQKRQAAHEKLFNTCLALKGIAALPKS